LLDAAPLDLHIHPGAATHRSKDVIKGWNSNPRGQFDRSKAAPGRLGNGSSAEVARLHVGAKDGVVMNDDDPIGRGMNVELDGVGPSFKCPLKRREGVLGKLSRCPAVPDSFESPRSVHRSYIAATDCPATGCVTTELPFALHLNEQVRQTSTYRTG
jgi:hypothetical protein